MYSFSFRHSQKGFSTLMALGTIAVLLIIVSGLALTYIREMRLSRTSYDEVVAYANAEGMFEYAMLKVRNHREGFSDAVDASQIDGKILTPVTERSKGVASSYVIEAGSTDHEFDLSQNEHLILPLFVGTATMIDTTSKNPNPENTIEKTKDLTVSLGALSWTIVAMSGSESVGLTGNGDISPSKTGIIRHRKDQCYSHTDGSEIPCNIVNISQGDEIIEYFYDETKKVSDFLTESDDPYLMIFNDSTNSQSIHVTGSTPFTLPTLTLTAQSQKNDSLQVFQFQEDKSKYYDALKYGVYNNNN